MIDCGRYMYLSGVQDKKEHADRCFPNRVNRGWLSEPDEYPAWFRYKEPKKKGYFGQWIPVTSKSEKDSLEEYMKVKYGHRAWYAMEV